MTAAGRSGTADHPDCPDRAARGIRAGRNGRGDGDGRDVVRLRRVADLDAGAVRRWWDLAARAAEPNPFAAPGVIRAAAAHVPGDGRVLLLTAERDGALTFALPVVREPPRPRRPFPVLSTRLACYLPLATPLLDPARGAAAWRAVRASAGAWLDADPMSLDGAAGRALMAAAGGAVRVPERVPRAVARKDGARITVSAKTRRSLEARRRALGAAAGAPAETFRVDPGAPVPPGLVDSFLALEASGWKGRAGTALAADPGTAAFFRELVAVHAARGGLQIVGVRCGGRLVAATVNLIAGPCLFFFKIAYDERFGQASPGRILMADATDAFAADPALTYADSCADPDASLSNQMLRDRREVGRVLVPGRGAAGALGRAALTARDAAARIPRQRPFQPARKRS